MRWVAALALASLPSLAAARGTCSVGGKSATFTVEVTPKGAAAFKLRVSGVPASIEPGGLGAPGKAHVKEPLAFDGNVATDDIPARTSRATEARNGLLRLAPATEKLTLHANVRATIVDAEVRVGGVVFRGLQLPCDALTLDAVAEPEARLAREHPDAPHFVAAGKLVHFRGQPNGGATMEAAVDDAGALELRQTDAQKNWLRVTGEWPDGTLVSGWVARDELAPAGVAHERLSDSLPPAHACAELAADATATKNPLKAGTQIFAARYLGAWAKVVDGAGTSVRVGKDDWAQLVTVPRISALGDDGCPAPLRDAWLPRAGVSAPDPR
jgi:hypothetical protein